MPERLRVILPWTVDVKPTWTVAQVRTALEQHEWGTFTESSKLWSAMGRDDRLSSVLDTRIDGVLGAACRMVPEDEEDGRAVKIAEDLDADWPIVAPRAQLKALLQWRLGVGVGYGRLVEKREASRWRYCLDVWDPQHLSYDDASKIWSVTTQEGQLDIEPGEDGWVLWCSGPRGWNDGMVRSLSVPWLIRAFAWRDWARYSEKHGAPIVVGKVPMVDPSEDKGDFFDRIRALSNETTITLPQGATPGESYDLSLLEATADTWEGFERLITCCNVSYAVRVLGQNLTTEVQGGSYAAAKVSDDVRTDIKRNDAEGLYAVAREQVLPRTVEANYGSGAPVPGPSYEVEPPADRSEQATAMKTFGEALGALKTAGIKPTNLDEIAEMYGLEVEEVEPPPPPPVMVPPGFAPKTPTGGGEPAADKADAEPPANATSETDDEEELSEHILLASGEPATAAPGFVAGQLYVDALATDGVRRSIKVFRPDLAAVKHIIGSSESFDECRAKLLQLYRDMHANDLQRLLERAWILGDLAGQWSVQEDL